MENKLGTECPTPEHEAPLTSRDALLTFHRAPTLQRCLCLLVCFPSVKDDTDTPCCQISNICHSSLPKVKTNMLIYCLLQAALRTRAGERARYVLCSLLRATCFPPSRLCCPAHAWLISPSLSWQSLRYMCTKGVSMNS